MTNPRPAALWHAHCAPLDTLKQGIFAYILHRTFKSTFCFFHWRSLHVYLCQRWLWTTFTNKKQNKKILILRKIHCNVDVLFDLISSPFLFSPFWMDLSSMSSTALSPTSSFTYCLRISVQLLSQSLLSCLSWIFSKVVKDPIKRHILFNTATLGSLQYKGPTNIVSPYSTVSIKYKP